MHHFAANFIQRYIQLDIRHIGSARIVGTCKVCSTNSPKSSDGSCRGSKVKEPAAGVTRGSDAHDWCPRFSGNHDYYWILRVRWCWMIMDDPPILMHIEMVIVTHGMYFAASPGLELIPKPAQKAEKPTPKGQDPDWWHPKMGKALELIRRSSTQEILRLPGPRLLQKLRLLRSKDATPNIYWALGSSSKDAIFSASSKGCASGLWYTSCGQYDHVVSVYDCICVIGALQNFSYHFDQAKTRSWSCGTVISGSKAWFALLVLARGDAEKRWTNETKQCALTRNNFTTVSTHRIHVCYIYGNIYHQYTPNVSIYTIHGSYGVWVHPADRRPHRPDLQ